MKHTILKAGLLLLAAGVLGAPLAGCRGNRTDKPPRRFFPDMDEQRKWDPQEQTEFFADGRTARVPPPNTVAFAPFSFDPAAHAGSGWASELLLERRGMLAESDAVYRGVEIMDDGAEVFVDEIPVPVTLDMVEHGQEMFNIYCASCHGYQGDGQGMVGRRWAYLPANLTSDLYRDRSNRQGKDGYIFDIILNGLDGPDGANRMPGYRRAMSEMDAWATVAYLRALQRAQGTPWDELSPEERRELGAPRPAQAPGENATDGGAS